ncbi:PREDICTED: TBC1 domain family member 17-like [Acropora digitifera]|uniref:TBC1 domain family member 17-like n=1 Tax=Acropora digitifera TaxID=70779 RepID=UPI00077A3899|nr:PREDICTED: TBC1 domain family member 17-like [Acropora digitifera]
MAEAISQMDDDGDDKEMLLVYRQDDVFVYTAVPTATQFANSIRGIVTVFEKENSSFVDWSPIVNEEEEFELDSSSDSECSDSECSESKHEGDADANTSKRKRRSKYAIFFDTAELHSIKRSDPKLGWSYAVFILKDGTTLPALHFHSGGISELIDHLQRYICITELPQNHELFVYTEDQSALKKSLDQLQLFSEDDPPFGIPRQKHFSSLRYFNGMDVLSHVTRYKQRSNEGLQPAGENTQTQAQDSAAKREVDFEHLGDTASTSPVSGQSSLPEKRDLGEVPEVTRCEPLKLNEWTSFLDDCGRVKDVKGLHERDFRGGVDDLIRKPVWQYLLGYKKYGYTAPSQQFLLQAKEEEYRTMKLQWQSMTQTQEKNFAEFRERKQLIDKDVARTDRQTDFYSEANHPNLTKLYDILLTYCMYNFDLVVAFSEEHDSGNMYFCFRWLLITFKREFSFPDIMLLWETLWSQKLSPNYHLIVCLAILDMHRNVIMENALGFTYILKYINDLAYTIDVQEVLIRAEQLCLQLRVYPGLPVEVKAILRGKNEAMMTPNVERMDPFLVVHSKHLDLLKDYGVVNANSAVRTLDLTASDLGESTHELNTNEETSSESAVQTTWNDLGNGVRPGTISVRNEGGPNENGNNEDQLSDGEEIVVLSEEAQNIF